MTCKFFWNHYVLMKTQGRLYGFTYRFPGGDAAIETSCAPFCPSKITRPSLSSKLHKYNIHGYKNALEQTRDEDLSKDYRRDFFVPSASPSNRRQSMVTHQ